MREQPAGRKHLRDRIVTQHPRQRGVGLEQLTIRGSLENALHSPIEDSPIPLFSLLNLEFESFTLANIAGNGRDADHFPRGIPDWSEGHGDIDTNSVLVEQNGIEGIDRIALRDDLQVCRHLCGAGRGNEERNALTDHLLAGVAEELL